MISTSKLTMTFGQTTLFEDVSVKFRPGNCYGLIGANGSGKSTFMKVLAGQMKASHGQVITEQKCSVGHLRQDHAEFDDVTIINTVYMGNAELWALHNERDELYTKAELTEQELKRCDDIEEEFAAAGGYTMEAAAAKLLVGLGFSDEQFQQKMSVLQGGFKLRVLLAQVLFSHPDILLLDEPTNHLDMESIESLISFLQDYEGTVIVISHDRFFLNKACTHIADLDYQEIRMFTGNYNDFVLANLEMQEHRAKQNKKAEARIHELKTFIARFSANASKARQATSRRKELASLQIEKLKPSSRVSPYIRFTPATRLGNKVIELKNVAKSYDAPLFDKVSLEIGPKEKIAMIGKNGVGKTTLLKIIAQELEPDSGVVTYGDTVATSVFPQDPSEMLDMNAEAVDWLGRFAPQDTDVDLRSFMGRMLFSGDDIFKPVKVLSGGEKARLLLAKMMLQAGNVLIMDEPTNHLDLESIEALNYGLSLVKETIIFVSHDHRMVNSLATRILQIADGTVHDHRGDFSSLLAR